MASCLLSERQEEASVLGVKGAETPTGRFRTLRFASKAIYQSGARLNGGAMSGRSLDFASSPLCALKERIFFF